MASRKATRGYTLIEIMIVIIILLVVMALVAPVIGNARNAAKRTTTRQLLNNLSQASQQFELDERRVPGYFNEVDMASTENFSGGGGRGFSSMANILLDLAGGIVATGTGGDAIQVGPRAANRVWVRVGLIGAPTQSKGVINKGYFTPDAKFFTVQNEVGNKVTNAAEHVDLPDLIDAFGQPILAWRFDIKPPQGEEFARTNSDSRTSFYRAPNMTFLLASSLGRKREDQNWSATPDAHNNSLLSINDGSAELSMAGFLGHPAFPEPASNPNAPRTPAAARGKLIFHSAGTDGVYLGSKDRGGVIARANGNVVEYTPNRDPLDNFDDVISVAGN